LNKLKRILGENFKFPSLVLQQRSQTRGPREGPMRPANIRKKEDNKINIGQMGLFFQKHWVLTQKKIFIFECGLPYPAFSLMRPARQFEFETPVLQSLILIHWGGYFYSIHNLKLKWTMPKNPLYQLFKFSKISSK